MNKINELKGLRKSLKLETAAEFNRLLNMKLQPKINIGF
jgi:hypothetical protein